MRNITHRIRSSLVTEWYTENKRAPGRTWASRLIHGVNCQRQPAGHPKPVRWHPRPPATSLRYALHLMTSFSINLFNYSKPNLRRFQMILLLLPKRLGWYAPGTLWRLQLRRKKARPRRLPRTEGGPPGWQASNLRKKTLKYLPSVLYHQRIRGVINAPKSQLPKEISTEPYTTPKSSDCLGQP